MQNLLVTGGCGVYQHAQAVKLVGVRGIIAVDELVLKLIADSLRCKLDNGCLDVLDIGTRLLDIGIDVGILPQDLQGGCHLSERNCG